MLRCTSTISKVTTFDGLHVHKSWNYNNFKETVCENRASFKNEWYDYENFPDEIMSASLSEHFFTRRKKMLSRPEGFMFYGNMGVEIFSFSEWPYPFTKNRLRQPEAYLTFAWLATTLTLVLQMFSFRFTLVVVIPGTIIIEREWTWLQTPL